MMNNWTGSIFSVIAFEHKQIYEDLNYIRKFSSQP